VIAQEQAEGKGSVFRPGSNPSQAEELIPWPRLPACIARHDELSLRKTSKPRPSPAPTARPAADPIFAAIEKHRKLLKAWNALYDALDRAETKAEKKHGQRPGSLVAWRNYSAIGGSAIEDRREEFLNLPGIDPKKIEKEYRAAKARERAGRRAERAWDKRAGIAAQRLELDRAMSAERRAAIRMAQIRPHTPVGAAALLTYTKADMEGGKIDWHEIALNTAINTLASWGKAPPRQIRAIAEKPARVKAVT
jgi:hypothetical protein